MTMDDSSSSRFAEYFTMAHATSEVIGGWDWGQIQELSGLAAEVLGFEDEDLSDLMEGTPDGVTRNLSSTIATVAFTGGGTTPTDGVTLRADASMKDRDVAVVAAIVVETHLLNGGSAAVEDLDAAWNRLTEIRHTDGIPRP